MEINHRIQIQNKNHELTCQLKEQKAINADQAEELKRQKEINQALEKENKKLRKLSLDNKLKIFGTGIFGVLTGFALKR
jgi:phage protein D